ncbi:MAG: hemerythrin domain-containing protein [Burkholderiaceae bacterium]
MKKVEWSDALLLEYGPMDDVHRAFVALLAAAQNASDSDLPAAWLAVVQHSEAHFGREDEWMRRTRFSAADSHMLQHRVVLNILREGLAMTRSGQHAPVREMTQELAEWFAKHTQTLDAALALHMRRQPAPSRSRAGHGVQPAPH